MPYRADSPVRFPVWPGMACRRFAAALTLLLLSCLHAPGRAASTAPFAMGVDHDETSFAGRWISRIYGEAFRRLGVPLRFVVYPTKRLSVMLAGGEVDGEAWRAPDYAIAYPDLVRVDEAVVDGRFALYAAGSLARLERIEDLAAANLRVQYRRGVLVCENTLKRWQPAPRLSDVTSTEQGLRNLLESPADTALCDTELAVESALHSARFKGAAPIVRLLSLSGSVPLYPYLHRKNAAMAPRLAAVLRQMKSEGLIERYRREVDREFARK